MIKPKLLLLRNSCFGRQLVCLWLLLIMLMPLLSLAATITSTSTGGNWDTGSTWLGGKVPAAKDIVIIATTSGNAVSLTANQTSSDVTINAGAILNLSSYTLTVNGTWLNNGTFNDGTGTVSFGSSSAEIISGTGTANFENVNVLSAGELTINAPVSINGDLTFETPSSNRNGIVTIASTNTLDVNGQVVMNAPVSNNRSTTINVDAGTLNVDGLVDMKANTGSKRNTIAITTGTANLNGGFQTGTTAPTIAAACLLTFSDAGTLNISGTISGGAPDLTQSTGTVNFKGATAQGIWLETYYDLGVFDGTKSLLGPVTVENQLNIASGTLQAGSFNVVLSGSGDAFINDGTLIPGTSTVNYSAAATTNIAAANYFNLNATGGDRVLPDGEEIGIAGAFTPGGGVYTVTGSVVNFNGPDTQTIPVFTFNDVILSGSGDKEIQDATEINVRTIEIQDGPSLEILGGGQLNITN